MRTHLLVGLGLLATASCTTAVPGRTHAAFWRTNGYDSRGEQQGRWRTYYDEGDQQQRWTRGRYRHGRPTGHWRYYTQSGVLDHEERYRPQYSDLIFYYPNGQVARRGRASVQEEGTRLHYFWFGDWQEFSDTGRLLRVDTYEKGKLVASHPITNS